MFADNSDNRTSKDNKAKAIEDLFLADISNLLKSVLLK